MEGATEMVLQVKAITLPPDNWSLILWALRKLDGGTSICNSLTATETWSWLIEVVGCLEARYWSVQSNSRNANGEILTPDIVKKVSFCRVVLWIPLANVPGCAKSLVPSYTVSLNIYVLYHLVSYNLLKKKEQKPDEDIFEKPSVAGRRKTHGLSFSCLWQCKMLCRLERNNT